MNQEAYDQFQGQEALQQQAMDSQQAALAPQLMEQAQQAQAILVAQTDPKKLIQDIISILRGVEEREDGTEVKIAEPKTNDLGIENISFILKSHINQNVILSHLKTQEISNIMNSLQSDLVDDLSLNWKLYGILKKTDLDTINNTILYNVFMALKRAENGNEKHWLGKISVENISGTSRPQSPKKESFFDKFRL